MHGRPRKAQTPEEQEAFALKASKLRALQSQFLHFHQSKIYTKEALDLNALLIEANPEFLTAWNYRKLAVQHNLSLSETEETIKSILDPELRVVEIALRKNPKCYGAWHHRKWLLSKGHSSTDRELRLLREFQKLDARNFHAWNYRRFITELRKISHEEELEYTTNMIYDNFSNYSAWHNRSVLLSHLMEKRVEGYFPENVLTEEFEFVRHALFTDPDDQSGWFYHLWLLDRTMKSDIPYLVSCWPPNGSDVYVSQDGSIDGCALSPFSILDGNWEVFPLILYFNEVVRGVNSSTVTVESECDLTCDLIWKPLSTNNFGFAQAWVALLKLPGDILYSYKSFSVRVILGESQGIFSLNGLHCSNHLQITFKVCVQACRTKQSEEQDIERILWSNDNFHAHEAKFQELSSFNLFHQLRTSKDKESMAPDWKTKIISNEIAHCQELLSTVDCKIGKLTLARLLMAHDAMMSLNKSDVLSAVHSEEVQKLFHDLIKMDSKHSQYYEDGYSLVVLKQVTSSVESLFRYCHQYRGTTSSRTNNFMCLRLNNLSLSRIGSIEQLLWIQMLDLSNNQFRSIEGLEVLQLLHSLNLSNNKLGSFTALEPLRLLKSLKVLNISYNEIGAHSIDTRRYLCSSPLTRTAGSDWKVGEIGIKNSIIKSNYWEAYSVFRNMNLIQLDIEGNAVAKENVKLLLFKILPTLRWLDGEELH